MQVDQWGDSLAVRLPPAVVEALSLKAGDQVTIEVTDQQTLRVAREPTREESLAHFMTFARAMPPGWKFARDEANERGG